jgi:hypothetical protein
MHLSRKHTYKYCVNCAKGGGMTDSRSCHLVNFLSRAKIMKVGSHHVSYVIIVLILLQTGY